MRVLISAIACHPSLVSEAFVGWQAVSTLREDHKLWIMTDVGSREAIEKVQKDDPTWKNVSFHYVGKLHTWHPNRMIARFESWMLYRDWCEQASVVARQLHQEVGFDLAHHVTYATWRMGSPLTGLGIPWIWGPIGGGEKFPWSLIGLLSPIGMAFEILRAISSWFAMRSRKIRHAVRDATLILASNEETKKFILQIGAPKNEIRVLSQAFLGDEQLQKLNKEIKLSPSTVGRLNIIAGGNLEGRKGVSIALLALAMAKKRGLKFSYKYLGYGPELSHLRKLVTKLGLSTEVEFSYGLQGEEYFNELKRAHVFLLPSLRESAGLTMIEAMAAGCVPIVADSGGPASICKRAGIRTVQVSKPESMAVSILNILIEIIGENSLWYTLSNNSKLTIQEYYSSQSYKRKIITAYNELQK